MTLATLSTVATVAANVVTLSFSIATLLSFITVRGTAENTLCRAVRVEVRPFVLPAVIFEDVVRLIEDPSPSRLMWSGVDILAWVWLSRIGKDDDDDRWDRRKRRLRDAFTLHSPAMAGAGA